MIPFQNTVFFLVILAAASIVYCLIRARVGVRRLSDVLNLKAYSWFYLVAVLMVSALIRVSTINMISVTSDEGFYIYGAWRMYEGARPYTDFILTQQPLYHYITSYIFEYAGVGVVQAKALPVLASILTVYFTYEIGKRFWNKEHAVVSAAVVGLSPYVVKFTNAATAYPEMILLNLLASYLFLAGWEGRDAYKLFACGFLTALAGLYKMLGLLPLAPIILYLLLKDRRNAYSTAVYVVFGFVVVFCTASAILYSSDYIYQVYIHHSLYEDDGWACKALEFLKVLAVDPVFMAPGLLGVAATLRKKKRNPQEEFYLLYIASAIPLVFVLKYLCGFAHPYLYFTLAIPAVGLLSGNVLVWARENAVPVFAALMIMAMLSFYIYLVAEIYNNSVVNEIVAYVDEYSEENQKIMGMAYLATPVAFKAGKPIPNEYMEFFHLRVEVEGYSLQDYRWGTREVSHAIMYDTRNYPVFNEYLRRYGVLEKTIGTIKPVRIYRIRH